MSQLGKSKLMGGEWGAAVVTLAAFFAKPKNGRNRKTAEKTAEKIMADLLGVGSVSSISRRRQRRPKWQSKSFWAKFEAHPAFDRPKFQLLASCGLRASNLLAACIEPSALRPFDALCFLISCVSCFSWRLKGPDKMSSRFSSTSALALCAVRR